MLPSRVPKVRRKPGPNGAIDLESFVHSVNVLASDPFCVVCQSIIMDAEDAPIFERRLSTVVPGSKVSHTARVRAEMAALCALFGRRHLVCVVGHCMQADLHLFPDSSPGYTCSVKTLTSVGTSLPMTPTSAPAPARADKLAGPFVTCRSCKSKEHPDDGVWGQGHCVAGIVMQLDEKKRPIVICCDAGFSRGVYAAARLDWPEEDTPSLPNLVNFALASRVQVVEFGAGGQLHVARYPQCLPMHGVWCPLPDENCPCLKIPLRNKRRTDHIRQRVLALLPSSV